MADEEEQPSIYSGDGIAQYAVIAGDESIEVRVSGEVDLASVAAHLEVFNRIDELLAAQAVPIVVNLDDVSFFGSIGLSFLLRLKRPADHANVEFLLRDVSQSVHLVLDVSDLEDLESGGDAWEAVNTRVLTPCRNRTNAPA